MKKYKKIESIFLAGNTGDSFYQEKFPEMERGQRQSISNYIAIFREDINSEECVCASEATEHSFFIITSYKKAEAILRYNKTTYALNDKHVNEHIEKFKGEFFLIWWDEKIQDRFHFVFIDSKEEKQKNVCIDSFGYDANEVLVMAQKLVKMIAQPINEIVSRNTYNPMRLEMSTASHDYSQGGEL